MFVDDHIARGKRIKFMDFSPSEDLMEDRGSKWLLLNHEITKIKQTEMING